MSGTELTHHPLHTRMCLTGRRKSIPLRCRSRTMSGKSPLALNEQSVINKICKWLNANLPNYITDDDSVRMNKVDFIEELRNAMAAEKEDETFK